MQSPTFHLGGFLILLILTAGHVVAQSTSSSLAPAEKNEFSSTITVKAPKKHVGVFSPKKAKGIKHRRQNVKHTARYEFYERVERAAKEKQKMMRILAKPQYSDPAYFGHKKKPKKRPPHKMRYCDECHIRH